MSPSDLDRVVARMRAWANTHPECDTQGIDTEKWKMLGDAAIRRWRRQAADD